MNALKPAINRAKELVELWEKEFPEFEIETIVADLEVKLPKIAKGMLNSC